MQSKLRMFLWNICLHQHACPADLKNLGDWKASSSFYQFHPDCWLL